VIPGLETEYSSFLKEFSAFSEKHFADRAQLNFGGDLLWQSMNYSLQNGGKRFRPFLAFLVVQSMRQPFEKVLPWALAVELIHTYSLIHDDLPCMDNDNFRRGHPTNHKVFGEAIALLAGDALQAEAYYLISSAQDLDSESRIRLVQMLSSASGAQGMVLGQVLDMKADKNISIKRIETMHRLKTAALIGVVVEGAARVVGLPQELQSQLRLWGDQLGLAFQIKDDLLDASDAQQDYKSYLYALGKEDVDRLLTDMTQKLVGDIGKILPDPNALQRCVEFNFVRHS
jgi:geranylgeranyl diphosphate synthase, type II